MVYSKALLVLVIFICASSIAYGLAENNDSNLAENNKDEGIWELAFLFYIS